MFFIPRRISILDFPHVEVQSKHVRAEENTDLIAAAAVADAITTEATVITGPVIVESTSIVAIASTPNIWV